VFPKKCGHFAGKQIIEAEEMVQKIKAAVDARYDQSLRIIARTDARAVEGLDRALDSRSRPHRGGRRRNFCRGPDGP
jgi:2-methylisocitrate lyase-like PEP mutase family enzyme